MDLSERNVQELWAAAERLTSDLAEQTQIVVWSIRAGRPPSYLDYKKAVMRGRGHCGLGTHPLWEEGP